MDNQVRQKLQDYIQELQSVTEIVLEQGQEEEKKEWMETMQCLLVDLEVYKESYPS
ncbi:hypothetical protein BQ9231_00269 [Cedratvirus lausannensis]|uniref:Uncharacterized protein n=1 Tax=Cedratvirus lausannensis TaxID=2023205 RepID=A0A285PY81_9VIRU|nr:hypothetical protein BQ9231_00269 [Cedratvirus lausannensis]